MKKNNQKLQLNRETLATLANESLGNLQGGGDFQAGQGRANTVLRSICGTCVTCRCSLVICL